MITNLKSIFTKIISACTLKKTFDKAAGVYFDGEKIFCAKLTLQDDDAEKWQVNDTAESKLFTNGQLSERSIEILKEFDAIDEDIIDSPSDEQMQEAFVKKAASICKDNWQIDSVALCVDSDGIITEIGNLSNIPKNRVANTVQYQIAAAGNFEIGTYLYSFMETDSGTWMEGIARANSSRWIKLFQDNGLQLLALTTIPASLAAVEDIDLSAVDSDFLTRGGMKAVFAARSLALQTNPNFLLEQTVDLQGWNYERIAKAIVMIAFLIIARIAIFDFWDYRQAQSALEYERSRVKHLEPERRKEEFIEESLAELRGRNQIISTLSEDKFSWRSLLVHFGAIKISDVWLKEVHSSENKTVEIKGETSNYEAVAEYVKALENDSDVFKKVHLKSTEAKSDGQLVQFVIELSF